MEKTKLETCIAILKILSRQPTSELDSSNEARAFKAFHEEYLVFLEHLKLVKQQKTGKNAVYKTTQRGLRVLNYFDSHREECHDTQIAFKLEINRNNLTE
jgi:predicted transcriptional regulator